MSSAAKSPSPQLNSFSSSTHSGSSSHLSNVPLTLAAFEHALQAVARAKFPGCVKRTSALARLRGGALKRVHLQFVVDSAGYCKVRMFKRAEDAEPAGELRFVGPDVQVGFTSELPVEAPGFPGAVLLRGQDLRRDDGRTAGDVFVFARNQSEGTQISHAVLALAKASRADGSCRFPHSASASSSATAAEHISKGQVLLVTRACNRILGLQASPKGLLTDLARSVDRESALEELDSPDPVSDPARAGRGLLEALSELRPFKPVPRGAFEKFAQAVHAATDMDATFVCDALETLLCSLASPSALKVVQDVTRAARHVTGVLKSNSLRQVADALGPGLVELRPGESDVAVALFAAAASARHRDRVFASAAASLGGGGEKPQLQQNLDDDVDDGAASAPAVSEPTEPSLLAAPALPAALAAVDENQLISEDIESLLRLHQWLSARLADDAAHPNADLWRKELEACTLDLSQLSPTMLLAPVRARAPAAAGVAASPKQRTAGTEGHSSGASAVAAPAHDPAAAPAQPDSSLVDKALMLWAGIRNEPLEGEAVRDTTVLLNDALDRVQHMAQTVQESDVPDASLRAATLALVGLLEENVRLRLRLAMVPPGSCSPASSARNGAPGEEAQQPQHDAVHAVSANGEEGEYEI